MNAKRLKGLAKTLVVTALTVGTVVAVVFLIARETGEDDAGYKAPTQRAMDTSLDITVQGRTDAEAKKDAEAAYKKALEFEAMTSRFKAGSYVARINENAGVRPVKVNPETLEMVKKSLELSRASDGAFDITVAPVVELWGFYDPVKKGQQERKPPRQEEIDEARKKVDWRKVIVDENAGTVMLADRGMQMDLGAVAKGYAVQALTGLLKKRGVKHALVNFGGAVGVVGMRSDGKPWVVGIRGPRGDPYDLVGELKDRGDVFVSSSGDYERFFIDPATSRRCCHIFDPRTGRQSTSVIANTVVGPDSTVADLLSTTIFIMGPEEGLAFLKEFPGYEAVVIDADGKVIRSPGMSDRYVIRMKERI